MQGRLPWAQRMSAASGTLAGEECCIWQAALPWEELDYEAARYELVGDDLGNDLAPYMDVARTGTSSANQVLVLPIWVNLPARLLVMETFADWHPSCLSTVFSQLNARMQKVCWSCSHETKLAGCDVLRQRTPQSKCHLCRHFAGESSSSADSDSSSDDLVGIGVMRSPAKSSQAQQPQMQGQGAAAGGRGGQGASPRGPRPGRRVDTSPMTWQGQVRDLGCE